MIKKNFKTIFNKKIIEKEQVDRQLNYESIEQSYNQNIKIFGKPDNHNTYLKNILDTYKEGTEEERVTLIDNLNQDIKNKSLRAIVLLAISYQEIIKESQFLLHLLPIILKEFYMQSLYYQIAIIKMLLHKLENNLLSSEGREQCIAFVLSKKTLNLLSTNKTEMHKDLNKYFKKMRIILKAEVAFSKLKKIPEHKNNR
eukprot:COSAG01_NODE_14_length_41020_cov_40.702133_43_plen_199_part_00